MVARRRRFGQVRKLPSGNYQASFVGPTGIRQNAPQTFRTKTDAGRWLAQVEADLSRGTWLDDNLSRQAFGEYAKAWLRDNPKMGPRYRETCMRNLRLHMAALADLPLRAITPAVVREWYAAALRGDGGRISIQQSYRFLRAVMNSAVRDGAITKNPCNIPGAGADRAKERPVASPAQVASLIEAITPRYRAAILLAAWCGLRRGEVLGLLAQDVDLEAGTVTIRRTSCRSSLSTWPPGQVPTAYSLGATAVRCAATPFGRRLREHGAQQPCRASASMTCATPARRWPPPLARQPKT